MHRYLLAKDTAGLRLEIRAETRPVDKQRTDQSSGQNDRHQPTQCYQQSTQHPALAIPLTSCLSVRIFAPGLFVF